jgi:transposase
MIDPEPILKARWRWVQMFERTQQVKLTCQRCGICRATLRKWWHRYQEQGEEGLRSRSRRPHRLQPRKVTPEQEALILELRRTRKLGPKGLQRELLRLHQLRFSTHTIWKILHAHGVSRLHPDRRPRQPKRYTRPEHLRHLGALRSALTKGTKTIQKKAHFCVIPTKLPDAHAMGR